MIDYSTHTLKLTALMNRMKKQLLKNNIDQAHETSLEMQAECKLLTNAIKHLFPENLET